MELSEINTMNRSKTMERRLLYKISGKKARYKRHGQSGESSTIYTGTTIAAIRPAMAGSDHLGPR